MIVQKALATSEMGKQNKFIKLNLVSRQSLQLLLFEIHSPFIY